MRRPLISVCVPTMRVGGLDVLFAGLINQTFRDFELVLSDALWSRRRDLVAQKAAELELTVTHVEPFDNPFPISAFCRYANTALHYARGELILFITDYTWLPPESLKTHAHVFLSYGPRLALLCPHRYVQHPSLAPDFPSYAQADADRYATDCARGDLDLHLWSIFVRPMKPNDEPRALPIDDATGPDPKLAFPQAGIIPSYFFHAKHESIPAQAVFKVNGWNEALDGTHGWQDTDLAERIDAHAQLTWVLEPSNVAIIVNPRHVFPWAKRLKPYEENEPIWRAAKAAGYPLPINRWTLQGEPPQ